MNPRIYISIACIGLACNPDTGDSGDTAATPPEEVDLEGAAAIGLVGPPPQARRIWWGNGEVHKVLDGGGTVALFPEGWTVDRLVVGGHRAVVVFSDFHWLGVAEGEGGLWCRAVSFTLPQPGDATSRALTCHLPTGLYDACSDPDGTDGTDDEGNSCEGFTFYDVDVGPDGLVWAQWIGPSDALPSLYVYNDTRAIRATPLTMLNTADYPTPVLGGAVFGTQDDRLENYWLESDGTVSRTDAEAQTNPRLDVNDGNVPRLAGYPLLRVPGATTIESATRVVVPLTDVAAFDPAPSGPLRFSVADGDVVYLEDDVVDTPTGGYRCTPDLQCDALTIAASPRWAHLRDASDRVDDGENTWVRRGDDEEYLIHDEVVSSELSTLITTTDVRLIGGVLHLEGVTPDNEAGLFRVGFAEGQFNLIPVAAYEQEIVQLVSLTVPGAN